MMQFQRAQTSVELVIVLAISLVILSVLVNFTTQTLVNIQKQEAVKTAQDSMRSLVEAVNQTFAKGSGSVAFVTITWPPGLDAATATLSGNTIRMRIYDTDVIGQTIPLVSGNLPTNEGTQRVRMVASDTNVTLGSLFLSTDQSSVYLPMAQDSNATAHVIVNNLSSSPVDVTFTTIWTHSGLVDVNTTPTTTPVYPGIGKDISIQASAGASAAGNYTGVIRATATFGSQIETIDIPLNIEVFSTSGSLLNVYPSPLPITASSGDTNYSTIQVCNDGETVLKTVSFTPSVGDAGGWITPPSTLSQIGANSCTDKNVSVTIPVSTDIGLYSGTLFISDYTGANTKILPLVVTTKGMASDFSWDWTTASTSATSISGFGFRNTGNANTTIAGITIAKWWSC
ncbi:MAG: hypothetical protein AABX02_04990, partial [archaeon]